MLFTSAKAIFDSAYGLFRNWRALALIVTIYSALLVTVYVLVTTREATTAQLVINLLLAIATPILFFMLQAACAEFAAGTGTAFLVKKSLRGFWKLAIVSLPFIALTVLAMYLLGKGQAHLANGVTLAAGAPVARPPVRWGLTAIMAIRYLLFGALVPLLLIQSWITVSRDGLLSKIRRRSFVMRTREVIRNAVAPESLLIYIAGFLVFAVIPYLVLTKPMPSKRAWVEVAVLSCRLLVSALLLLLGWVTTVGALSISASKHAAALQNDES